MYGVGLVEVTWNRQVLHGCWERLQRLDGVQLRLNPGKRFHRILELKKGAP